MPRALIIRTAGTNCDEELARAFSLAGATTTTTHLDALIASPNLLDSYDLLAFPGGFSYGDDIAAGRIFASKVRTKLYPSLIAAVDRGACIIGVCNGFQVLVQAGLLPGPSQDQPSPETAPTPTVGVTENINARFIDQWIPMLPEPSSICIWTQGLQANPETLTFPIAHGEGRFVADQTTIAQLESTGRIALRYADNVNGSDGAIAGICDTTGRVFGLMPHPERYLDWNRHPYATRLPKQTRQGDTPGLQLFKNAVEAVTSATV